MEESDPKTVAAPPGESNPDGDVEKEGSPDVQPDQHISPEAGRRYWSGIPSDVDGMLGGYGRITKVDLQGSRSFLAKLGIGKRNGLRTVSRCLEGGAGIGRITKGLLLDVAQVVDVVEPNATFTADGLRGVPGVGTILNIGLEDWQPDEHEYDLVWNQWCVGHLRDDQLTDYLRRCRDALAPGGFVVVKENLSSSGADIYDELDSSVTRHDQKFRDIFHAAGLIVSRHERQNGLPDELYPVRMYALRPMAP